MKAISYQKKRNSQDDIEAEFGIPAEDPDNLDSIIPEEQLIQAYTNSEVFF